MVTQHIEQNLIKIRVKHKDYMIIKMFYNRTKMKISK